MPETIRTANERLCSRPRRGGHLAAFVFAPLSLFRGPPASAAGLADGIVVSREQLGALTLTLGLVCFAVLATVVLLRTRRTADAQESAAQD